MCIRDSGRRAKEYENSINFLVTNQLIYRSYKIRVAKSPLSSCRELDSFKLYLPDDGLLSMRYNLTKDRLRVDENVKQALYEHHIAHTLVEAGYSLYYYQSEGKAEVSFVIQNRMGKIIPIELADVYKRQNLYLFSSYNIRSISISYL